MCRKIETKRDMKHVKIQDSECRARFEDMGRDARNTTLYEVIVER